jgi:hypothetical protein
LANSEAVFRALAAYGAPLSGLSAEDFRDDPNSVFQIGQPPARVDILQHIDGVSFDEAWEERTEASLSEMPAHFISVRHLVRNKLKSGRTRDLADAEAIQAANPDLEV